MHVPRRPQTRAPRVSGLLLALACVFGWGWPAQIGSAQFVLVDPPAVPSAAEVARARESFDNGLAHGEAGRWPEAVLAFEEAYRRSGNPVALLNLAAALQESGRAAEARTCVIALRARYREQLDPETRKRADELYGSVTAVVELHAAPATAMIAIDGQTRAHRAQHFELDPGLHHFRVSAPGREPFEWRGILAAGEVRHLQYESRESETPLAPSAAAAAPTPSHHDSAPDAPKARRRLPRWAIGVLVSAATLAVGAAVAVPLVLRDRGMDAPSGVDVAYELP